jgi:nitrogen fixation protein NifU and related proteins
MPIYTEKVMDHFANPRNVGEIADADGVGNEGNPVCGDMMTFYIKVKDDRLDDVKFKTFGCGAAIAVSSMVSEMAKGKTLEEAKKITREQVAEELGGLPPNKMHCSNLGAEALQKAIADYESKNQPKAMCRCPFCNEEFKAAAGACKGCGANISFCSHCGKPLLQGAATCSECGAATAA